MEAVKTMVRIAERTEQDVDYRKRFYQNSRETDADITKAADLLRGSTADDVALGTVFGEHSGRSAGFGDGHDGLGVQIQRGIWVWRFPTRKCP